MKKILIILSTLLLSSCSLFGIRSEEEPKYKLLEKNGSFELREYSSYIVAEVVVKGKDRREAANNGFRILANYIFGDNESKTKVSMTAPVKQSEKISMTSPVKVSEKISMTAPVKQSEKNDKGEWNIAFVMPEKYTLETLPLTKDDRIKFKEVNPYKVAVWRFSGLFSESNLDCEKKKFEEYIKSSNIKTKGEISYNFYDPPWTIPFFKRNEMHISIQD